MKRRYKKRLVNYFFLFLITFTIFPSFQIQGNIFPVIENNDVIQQQSQYTIFNQETSIEYNQPSSIVSPNVTVSNSAANMVNYHLDTKTTTYEYFDLNSYSRRGTSNSYTVLNDTMGSNLENNVASLESSGYIPKDIEYGISATSIIDDGNDRIPVEGTKTWPYTATVYIRTYFFNLLGSDDKIYYVIGSGTGFMEGPNLLVTAGHCVYGDVTKGGVLEDNIINPRFPDKVEVYAGVNGESELSSSYKYYSEVSIINIQKEYFDNTNLDYDWAACQLNTNLGNLTGYYGKIGNWYEQGYDVYSYGYPGDKPTATMWEAHGKTVSQTNLRFDYDFDSYYGQSGSPVFMATNDGHVYVCGIHTAGGYNVNGGTKINSFIFHYLNSFVTNHNYEHLAATITPSDYDFADAYPTVETTKTHTLSTGFEFSTTRYRTGFIQGEYVVMSPFRESINKAYIKYNFSVPISKIEVDLTHWRLLSNEWTYPSNCTAVLRTNKGVVLDLLSSETNLPTDRTQPTTYSIVFDQPVYSFEFYMESKRINTNDNNRGRLCIGDMKVYATEGWH